MSYEVDVLAVGNESQSGDAFALRFGDFVNNPNNQYVVVIDGGFKESGEKLVQRIRNEYKSNHVDLVISTHPDNDHVSGLHVVLEEMEVDTLWMHRPWNKNEKVKSISEDRSLSLLGLPISKLKKSLECAYDLEKLAVKKGITIEEPYQGKSAFEGVLHVLGPSEDFYNQLAMEFEKSGSHSLLQKVKRAILEAWHTDELAEPESGSVSPRNNSSVVLLVRLGEDHFLFCGDAGVEGLDHAVTYANTNGYDIAANVKYHQVPHHGSKRNLGPTILNQLVGPILPENQLGQKEAFISAAVQGDPKHPSKRVINALIRRGVKVNPPTAGRDQYFRSLDVPMRENWFPMTSLGFYSTYDEED